MDKKHKSSCYYQKKIIIATGSVPNYPNIPGSEYGISSDIFFELKKIPKKISIVGSGYIALEFAFLLKNLNYDVDLIFRKQTILNEFDKDIGSRVLNYAIKKGINLFRETSLKKIKKTAKKTIILTNNKTIKTDLLIYAIGRTPNIQSLNLKNTKVLLDKNYAIKVNKNSRSRDKNIYAIGDVTNRKNLTPVAIREAVILFNFLSGKKTNLKLNYNKVASAIFTQPEVGSIGYGEKDLKKLNIKYKVLITEFNPLKYSFYGNKKSRSYRLWYYGQWNCCTFM